MWVAQWFTIWWMNPSVDNWAYATHSSDQMVVPGETIFWMMGSRVAASRSSTSSMYPSFSCGSQIPNTQRWRSQSWRPWWYFALTMTDSWICTQRSTPPSTSDSRSNFHGQMSRKYRYHWMVVVFETDVWYVACKVLVFVDHKVHEYEYLRKREMGAIEDWILRQTLSSRIWDSGTGSRWLSPFSWSANTRVHTADTGLPYVADAYPGSISLLPRLPLQRCDQTRKCPWCSP